jgi:hypothetical protein
MRPSKISILHPYMKGFFEGVFYILTIVVLYHEYMEYNPPAPAIILEIEQLETSTSLTGVASDQDYLLDYIKIYPDFNYPVKRATFQYGHYKKQVDLIESQKEHPIVYMITKELLQKELGEQGFRFEFLDDNRFTFHFQFSGNSDNPPQFECDAGGAIEIPKIDCQIREKTSLSIVLSVLVYLVIPITVLLLIIRLLKMRNGPIYGKIKSQQKKW